MSIEVLEYIPDLKDFIVPAVGGGLLWILRKVKRPSGVLFFNFARWLVHRDTVRSKRIRTCPFAIQREISKESALFVAFVLSATIALSALTVTVPSQPWSVRIALYCWLLLPVVVVEIWWISHKQFVSELLKSASRIGPGFKRLIPPRQQGDRRIDFRRQRQKKIRDRALNRGEHRIVPRRMN